MRVLVLGATGLIGNAIVRQLVASGYRVAGTCRRGTEHVPNLAGLRMRVLRGDIDDPESLDRWIEGQDVVVDAAAPYPLHLMYTAVGRKSVSLDHVEIRTATLIEYLRRHGARLIHVSTLLAQSTRPRAGFTGLQKQLMRTIHPYFSIKSLIERQLERASDTLAGVAIVQPSACLGPYDVKSRDQSLVPKAVCGEIPVSFSHRMNVIDTRDVALGIAAVIEKECYQRTIPLTGHNTSIESLLSEIATICGTTAPRWRYPAELSVLPSYWTEIAWAAVGRPSPLPSLLPILISEQGWEDVDEAQRELGIVPRPLDETLRDTIDWYRDLGYC